MRLPSRSWQLVLVAVAVTAVVATIAVAATRHTAPLRRLTIAAGGLGGVYYAYGQGLATAVHGAYPDVDVRVLATAASVENLRLVATGAADVGFSLADAAALPVPGRGPQPGPAPLRALAWLYDNYAHLVVRADSPVRTVAGLRGRFVSTGASGSGTELIAGRILLAAGIGAAGGVHRSSLDLGESVAALRDGRIDAFFFSGGLPTPAIAQLAGEVPIRLVGLAEFAPDLRSLYGDFYTERSIPATTYGLGQEVTTIGTANLLVVREDMPVDEAFTVTRLLFGAKPALVAAHPEALRLDPRAAVDAFPLALHPGAERYYREAKP